MIPVELPLTQAQVKERDALASRLADSAAVAIVMARGFRTRGVWFTGEAAQRADRKDVSTAVRYLELRGDQLTSARVVREGAEFRFEAAL